MKEQSPPKPLLELSEFYKWDAHSAANLGVEVEATKIPYKYGEQSSKEDSKEESKDSAMQKKIEGQLETWMMQVFNKRSIRLTSTIVLDQTWKKLEQDGRVIVRNSMKDEMNAPS